jgi:cation transporter-like permease
MKTARHHSFFFIVLTTGLASSISLIGGIGLELVIEKLLPLIPLIVALPSLNTMVGDYAAIIAAHAGDPAEREKTKSELAHAISKSIFVNIIGVLVLSIVIAARRGYVFEPEFMIKFLLFVPISMISIVAFMFVLTTILDKLLTTKRLNPDDILIPIVTSITDVLMLGLITVAAYTIF